MADRSALPLDQAQYAAYLAGLAEIVHRDPQLDGTAALRAFVETHQEWFGPRTARTTLRTLIHIMVLAASELADLHPASRTWLTEHGRGLPPWDVTVPRTAQRLVT